MANYFYKGKHRKPTHNVRNTVTVLGVTALTYGSSAALPTSAIAGPPGGWDAIIECESGNRNIENQSDPNSSASGYLQFTDGTWRHFGGTEFASRAINASRPEQIAVAERAYAANGLRDWNASRSCWRGKVGGSTSVTSRTASRATERVRSALQPVTPLTARTHVVRSGETLSKIAGRDWRSIYERNKEVIGSNPDLIFPGQRLQV